MKFKKLILPATIISAATPISLVSCVNPFTQEESIKQARLLYKNNNLFNDKSFAQFDEKILKPKYGELQNYENVKVVLKKSFDEFKNEEFASLQKFYHQFKLKIKIYKRYKINNESIESNITKEQIADFIYYLVKNTPFQHQFMNIEAQKEYETFASGIDESKTFKFEKYTNDPRVLISGILPKFAFKSIFDNTSLNDSVSKEKVINLYKKIILREKELIKSYDPAHEHTIQDAFAPMYYILPNGDKYLSKTYSDTISIETSMIKKENRHLLPKDAMTKFMENPKQWVKDNKKILNKNWLKNKEVQEIFEEAVDESGKIGKYGLAYMVAYVLYNEMPNNIQIIQFKDTTAPVSAPKLKFLVQVTVGGKSFLLDPVKDFEATVDQLNSASYKFAYESKDELPTNFAVDSAFYINNEIGSEWK